jgi:hypothetical protein
MSPGRAAVWAAALWIAAPGLSRPAGDVVPGAYCPLPKAGERPECLEPARGQYGAFFAALETGEPSDTAVEQVEADLARGVASERAYLALSSLAYGYYRLAQLASATPGEDPSIVARLERWNGLLSGAYASSPDPAYRRAVRRAAEDLDERSAVELPCVDAAGHTVPCRSTEVLLRGLDQAGAEVGVRGALRRMLRRIFGGAGS